MIQSQTDTAEFQSHFCLQIPNTWDLHHKSDNGVTAVISASSSGSWAIFSAQKHEICNLSSLQPYDLLVYIPATMAYFHELKLKLL